MKTRMFILRNWPYIYGLFLMNGILFLVGDFVGSAAVVGVVCLILILGYIFVDPHNSDQLSREKYLAGLFTPVLISVILILFGLLSIPGV